MNEEMKNRLIDLYNELVHICDEAPREEDCTPEENDLFADVWNLRSAIKCSGILEE